MLTSATPDNVISLLLIENSPNQAEKYVNAIRNAGIAVHANRVGTEDQLEEALESNPPDMVVCCCEGTEFTIARAVDLLQAHPQIPLIVLYQRNEEQGRKSLLAAMLGGARDIVPRDDLTHLQLVVKRELESLHRLRAVNDLERKLKESEDRCNALMQTSRDAIAYVHEGMHVRANPAYLKMFGYIDMDEIEGMPILDMVTAEHHKELKNILRSADSIDLNNPLQLEAKCETAEGKDFDAVLEFSPASIDGEPCTQVLVNNQRYKKELEKKLAQLSTQDVQTGLHNRSYFMHLLTGEEPHLLASLSGHALLYISIDGYAQIRKETGIIECDQMVKELASLLKQQTSPETILARFTEQSFALLTPTADKQALSDLARKICAVVETHVYPSQNKYSNPSCSIGIAVYDDELGLPPADFVSTALHASEEAEQNGGNQYAFAGTVQVGASADMATGPDMGALIAEAVANNRFRLVYQPIVSLQGDNRENYAVMVRVLSEDKQEVMPSDFLLQAEKSGHIAQIDRWMLEHAAQELARQRAGGKSIHFFLPVSGASIQQEGFLLEFYNLLEQHSVKGNWLTLQVSEVSIRSRIQEFKELIEGIKQVGCELAIDHFGLLPKGESLLKHLPVDYVKLDPSFVNGIARNAKKQEEVGSVHQLINNAGAKTVATGVEDANSLAILWNMGVNYLQGYFLQEPSEVISYDFSHF